MKIEDYYRKLLDESVNIFNSSLKYPSVLTVAHNAALDLSNIAENIDRDEADMIRVVCSQLELSCLSLSLGLYRQAFSALRLSLEFGLGAVWFSSNKLSHREWINGSLSADLKWHSINDADNGVLSARYVSAFFPELKDYAVEYRGRAGGVYRCLSEFVHGNSDTWKVTGVVLSYNKELQDKFEVYLREVVEVLKFSMCARYLLGFSAAQHDDVQEVFMSAFSHIEPIRLAFGGPEDPK